MSDSATFATFLRTLQTTREELDAIFRSSLGAEKMGDAMMVVLWQGIYDALVNAETPEERLKWGALIEKLFSALTSRRALELREDLATRPDAPASKTPLDAATTADIEQKLKLL